MCFIYYKGSSQWNGDLPSQKATASQTLPDGICWHMYPMSDVGYLFCRTGALLCAWFSPMEQPKHIFHTREPGLPGVGLCLVGQLHNTQVVQEPRQPQVLDHHGTQKVGLSRRGCTHPQLLSLVRQPPVCTSLPPAYSAGLILTVPTVQFTSVVQSVASHAVPDLKGRKRW